MNIKKLLIFLLYLGTSLPINCMWKNALKNFFNKKALFATAAATAGFGFGYTSADRAYHKTDDLRLYILKQQKLKRIREYFPAYFKSFVLSPLLQKDVFTTDLETLKKIATHCPEASVVFGTKLAEHVSHTAILNEKTSGPASKEHKQLVRDIALKLQLNPTHAIIVLQNFSYISKIPSTVTTVDATQWTEHNTMSPFTAKAKYFMPYIHVIKLEAGFSYLSPNEQKFIVGHELMHAKLGHTLKEPQNKAHAREREKECDLGSAALGPEFAQGGIERFSSMPRFYQNGELLGAEPHDLHPSDHERTKYLKAFARKNYPTAQTK